LSPVRVDHPPYRVTRTTRSAIRSVKQGSSHRTQATGPMFMAGVSTAAVRLRHRRSQTAGFARSVGTCLVARNDTAKLWQSAITRTRAFGEAMYRARFLSLAFLVGIIGSTGCPRSGGANSGQVEGPVFVQPLAEAQRVRFDSGMDTRQRLVVRNRAAWVKVWHQLVGNKSHTPPVPAVDFESNVVIVAAMGTRSSGGFSIDIDDVHFVDGDARISVTERSPGEWCGVTLALTAPVAVVVVSRFPGRATFLERTEQRACQKPF
jgi:hypothetical protein